MILEIAYVNNCNAILDNDIASLSRGGKEPVQRVHMILEIAYFIYCKAILDNDIASRGGKEPVERHLGVKS